MPPRHYYTPRGSEITDSLVENRFPSRSHERKSFLEVWLSGSRQLFGPHACPLELLRVRKRSVNNSSRQNSSTFADFAGRKAPRRPDPLPRRTITSHGKLRRKFISLGPRASSSPAIISSRQAGKCQGQRYRDHQRARLKWDPKVVNFTGARLRLVCPASRD